MIIEFRVGNFRSIFEEQVLSFVAGTHKEMENPHHTFLTPEKKPQRLLKSLCLYGANASGKSNVLLAMRVMIRIIQDSNSYRAGDAIQGLQTFAFDADAREGPTLFELTFLVDVEGEPTRAQYGFKVDSERIHEEWLYTFPKGYARCWFHREPEEEKIWSGSEVKGIYRGVAERTNENVLFLSKAGGSENHPRLEPVYQKFKDQILFLDSGRQSTDRYENFTRKMFHDDKAFVNFAAFLLQQADMGVVDVRIHQTDIQLPDDLPPEMRREILDKHEFEIRMVHEGKWGDYQEFALEDESLGTRRLLMLAGPIYYATHHNALLVIDEMEASLHPLLTQALLKFIHNSEELVDAQAQLVFTTHQTHLLDTSILRRDQIWFTEKNENHATRLFSLWDFKTRKDRALEKGYLAGLFGAIPHLELLDE